MFLSQMLKPKYKVWETLIDEDAIPAEFQNVGCPGDFIKHSIINLGKIPDILQEMHKVCYLTNGHFAELLIRQCLSSAPKPDLNGIRGLYEDAYCQHAKSIDIQYGLYPEPKDGDLNKRLKKLEPFFIDILDEYEILRTAVNKIKDGDKAIHQFPIIDNKGGECEIMTSKGLIKNATNPRGFVDFLLSASPYARVACNASGRLADGSAVSPTVRILEIKATKSDAVYGKYNHHQLLTYGVYTNATRVYMLNMLSAELWTYDMEPWSEDKRSKFKDALRRLKYEL